MIQLKGNMQLTQFRRVCRLFSSMTVGKGLIEIREYTIKPEYFASFLAVSQNYSDLRKQALPFLGMFTCETGGILNRVIHFYYYEDLEVRDKVRGALARNEQWQNYLLETKPFVQKLESRLMKEASSCYAAANMPCCAMFTSPEPTSENEQPIYEMREYQLIPGYQTVPDMVQAFSKGLPDKLLSYPERQQCVFLGYSEVGTLNNFVELWRYNSCEDSIKARVVARSVQSWRDAIANVAPLTQTFKTAILKPTQFSPWK
eukprot:TRINITY_DN3521_c0_g1_i3.p1 TRINITY_DN3521_c0_g1~~TRINITY_DN3521_c0_g1_i3.p1  ORF type:complete len:259 (-),score=21.41 TRINITY_DN3521_c0_g1_i3:323-1099(-)